MAMTIEERKAQLERKQTTQGLGENTTIGGDATNHGRNKGIIEGGLAHDGGLGNGRIKGGSSINNNHNEDIIEAGAAINHGKNNGDIGGGHSSNYGINKNTLKGGLANNEFGSVNTKYSYLKGGDAVRELQHCVETYDGNQKQLKAMKDDFAKIKESFSDMQADGSALSQSEKDRYETLLKEKNEEIKKLNEVISSDLEKIDNLVSQLSDKDQEIKSMAIKIKQAIEDKNKLEERLVDINKKIIKANDRIEALQSDIHNKESKIAELEQQLNDDCANKEELNKAIASLKKELNDTQDKLENNQSLISKREETISRLNIKITKMETEYSQKQQEFGKKLEVLLEQIASLANEGKEELSDSIVTTSSKTTTVTISNTADPLGDIKEQMAPAVTGGNAENLGINSGTIKAGDSNSQSMVMNNEININVDGKADTVVSTLRESISSMGSRIEGVANGIVNEVKQRAQSVLTLVNPDIA